MNFRGRRLGLMADSHGCPEAIMAGIALLQHCRCDAIVHLGDIVDSCRPETAADCVAVLRDAQVIAIKGNNDHALVKAQAEQNEAITPEVALDYLRGLPLRLTWGELILAHSLPFDQVLGDACMIRPLGTAEIAWFFQDYHDCILFRGHSHLPEVCIEFDGKPTFRTLNAGDTVRLAEARPCLITCGALTNGYCMTFDALEQRLAILSFSTRQGA